MIENSLCDMLIKSNYYIGLLIGSLIGIAVSAAWSFIKDKLT